MSVIQLPEIYASHMTLQRDKVLRIEGRAEGSEKVRVVLDGQEAQAPVRGGKFSCGIGPFPAGTGKTMSIFAGNDAEPSLMLEDIQIGDIYLACGQSNMEYFLRYDSDWNYTQLLKHNPMIRMYNVPQIAFEGQKKECFGAGYWFEEGDPGWAVFSAPGYHFARLLQEEIQVPVAVVGCNWGGTPACAWTDTSWFSKAPLDVYLKEYENEVSRYEPEELERLSMEALAYETSYRHELETRVMMYGLTEAEQQEWMKQHAGDPKLPMGPWHHYRPGGLRNTMIEKIASLSVKGVLWYQGESDSGHGEFYDQTMEALIGSFREVWKEPELPFLFVQLAPFGQWLDCVNKGYALVRAAQERTARKIEGTAMASIMDLGSYEDIHPKFKKEVGCRLALLALKYVYDREISAEGPEFLEASARQSAEGDLLIRLSFKNTGEGLKTDSRSAEAFRIFAGEAHLTPDGTCSEAPELPISSFEADRESISLTVARDALRGVWNPGTALYLSYAEENYCTVHLWNSAGLSMKPFHSRI